MTDTSPARAALRDAHAARADARERRQAALDALSRADAVLAAAQEECERHAHAAEAAEAQRAEEVAATIRRGATKPAITMSAAVTAARHAHSDVVSRQTIAAAARDQLAAELADAESALAAAARAAAAAAVAVVFDEARPLAAALADAQQRFLDIIDQVAALAYAGVNLPVGVAAPPPPEVADALFAVQNLRHVADMLRPPTIAGNGPAAVASARLRAYVAALVNDASARLEDILPPPPPTPIAQPNPPPSWPITKLTGEAA